MNACLSAQVRAHVRMPQCMHVHLRVHVGAHACTLAGAGSRVCGYVCVRARIHAGMITMLYYYVCGRSV